MRKTMRIGADPSSGSTAASRSRRWFRDCFRRVLWGGILLAVCGCASNPPDRSGLDATRILLGPELVFRLPPWRAPHRSVDVVQMLTGRYEGETFSLQVRLSVNRDGLEAVGLDPFGRRGFHIFWGADGVTSEQAAWLPDGVNPGNVLADIVFAHWPASELKAGLEAQGYALREQESARDILFGDRPVVHVSYDTDAGNPWDGRLTLANRVLGYEIDIDSKEIR